MLDQVAQRYGRRPSELLGVPTGALALTIDIRCAQLGSQAERAEIDRAAAKRKR